MSMENADQGPHVAQDNDGGNGPNSTSTSSPRGMFSDASDETRQIHAIEQMEDDILEAANPMPNANLDRMDDVSMGTSLDGTMSTSSSTEPSSVSSSWNGGEYEELFSELGRADRRQYRHRTVVWQHIGERIFSAIYVCPFSGECFLSGHCIDEVGYARSEGDLHWYDSQETAKVAAIRRKIDCSNFRELPPESAVNLVRHCRDIPYRAVGQVLPAAIPDHVLPTIQMYQRQAWGSRAPSIASTDVSPLTPVHAGSPTLRPLEQDPVNAPQNLLLSAPLTDRNARKVLNERYQGGVINGHYVQECSIPKSNFLFEEIGTSHQLYFTCIFVCPLFGDWYACGQPEMDRSSAHLMHGLWWFRQKSQAKAFAAARAIDCFELREGSSRTVRYCREEPYLQGNGPALETRWQRVFSPKIQLLQADARQRLLRFSRQH